MASFYHRVRQTAFFEQVSIPTAVVIASLESIGINTDFLFWLPVRAVCMVRGHKIVDGDLGNPENGPRPHIHCARCGITG